MRKILPLMIEPSVMDNIPDIDWFSNENVIKMLKRYPTLFIKPNKGRIGNGVMRLRNLGSGEYEIHDQDQATVVHSVDDALRVIHKRMALNKAYLVQQGIDLATVLDRPFDLRVVMHKVDGKWKQSAWCAKISPPKWVVTNHAKGGVILTIGQALKLNKHLFDKKKTMDQISDICMRICKVFDRHFTFGIIGLDMAVDKSGHIWFIEANTSPVHKMFKQLGDPRIYKKLKRLDRKVRFNSEINNQT